MTVWYFKEHILIKNSCKQMSSWIVSNSLKTEQQLWEHRPFGLIFLLLSELRESQHNVFLLFSSFLSQLQDNDVPSNGRHFQLINWRNEWTTVRQQKSDDLESIEIFVAHIGAVAVAFVRKLEFRFHQKTVQHPMHRPQQHKFLHDNTLPLQQNNQYSWLSEQDSGWRGAGRHANISPAYAFASSYSTVEMTTVIWGTGVCMGNAGSVYM